MYSASHSQVPLESTSIRQTKKKWSQNIGNMELQYSGLSKNLSTVKQLLKKNHL